MHTHPVAGTGRSLRQADAYCWLPCLHSARQDPTCRCIAASFCVINYCNCRPYIFILSLFMVNSLNLFQFFSLIIFSIHVIMVNFFKSQIVFGMIIALVYMKVRNVVVHCCPLFISYQGTEDLLLIDIAHLTHIHPQFSSECHSSTAITPRTYLIPTTRHKSSHSIKYFWPFLGK